MPRCAVTSAVECRGGPPCCLVAAEREWQIWTTDYMANKIDDTTGAQSGEEGNGYTLLEALIVVAIILILAAIAIPGELRSRQIARRGVVITELQTLHDELSAYEMMCGGFPPSLPAQGSTGSSCSSSSTAGEGAVSTSASDSAANPPDPVPILMSGYRFTYTLADLGDDGLYHGYAITADPIGGRKTGNEFYFSDQTGVVRVHINEEATASDPPLVP